MDDVKALILGVFLSILVGVGGLMFVIETKQDANNKCEIMGFDYAQERDFGGKVKCCETTKVGHIEAHYEEDCEIIYFR